MQRSFLLAVFLGLLVLAAGPNLLTTSANQSYEVVTDGPRCRRDLPLARPRAWK